MRTLKQLAAAAIAVFLTLALLFGLSEILQSASLAIIVFVASIIAIAYLCDLVPKKPVDKPTDKL